MRTFFILGLGLSSLGCKADKTPDPDDSFACVPDGDGPFTAALYNHGGLGDAVGGDLDGTCEALADAGYLAYSKQRRLTESLDGHLDDVQAGIDALADHSEWDGEKMAILGFSRGGLLTLQMAKDQPSLFGAVVLMAPADAKGTLYSELEDVSAITAPVAVLVSENDLYQDDHVALAEAVPDALSEAGKEVEYIEYGPYASDGHERFFEVGSYWSDVTSFLETGL
jgi:dienelactone hydrolase